MTVSLTKAPEVLRIAAAMNSLRASRDAFTALARPLELRTALVHLDGVTAPLVSAGTYRARLHDDGLI